MDSKFSKQLRPFFNPGDFKVPTPEEEACTIALETYLDEHDPLETKEDTKRREFVLVELNRLTKEWTKSVLLKKGVPEEDANSSELFISGSYRMGVATKGADLDTVLVAPYLVTVDDFFEPASEEGSLLSLLLANPSVTHIHPIPTARVPLIEVIWSGIELDLLFSGLDRSEVPKSPEDLLDDSLLVRMEDRGSVLSLNGPRVTELLLKLLPRNTLPTFTLLLRALRFWAKRRGIYSNKMGFLGGVNYAILACHILQIFPTSIASRGLLSLMALLESWQWPTPIRLVLPYDDVPGSAGIDYFQSYEPNPKREHMPIITPAWPNFNSSSNVSMSTAKIMKQEFSRGYKITRRITKRAGLNCRKEDWEEFFEPEDFFFRYTSYISIVARAKPSGVKGWCGLVESTVRKFVEFLELDHKRLPLLEIRPYQTGFPLKEETNKNGGKEWFIGLLVDVSLARQYLKTKFISLEGCVNSFSQNIMKSASKEDESTLDIAVFTFKDMVFRYPEFYPKGDEDAFQRHQQIHLDLENKRLQALQSKKNKKQQQQPQQDSVLASDSTAAAPPAHLMDIPMVQRHNKVHLGHDESSHSRRPLPLNVVVMDEE